MLCALSFGSRVLNPETRKMVTEEIAEKVTRASAELGYRPTPCPKPQNQSIFYHCVMVPDLTNAAFALIIKGIDNVQKSQVTASSWLIQTIQLSAQNATWINFERQVDGLVIATASRQDELVADCRAEARPCPYRPLNDRYRRFFRRLR